MIDFRKRKSEPSNSEFDKNTKLDRQESSNIENSFPQREGEGKGAEVDVEWIENQATQLLAEAPKGDEHFPGEVNVERIDIHHDLPRRT